MFHAQHRQRRHRLGQPRLRAGMLMAVVSIIAFGAAGCALPSQAHERDITVAASTPIIADVVRQVAGEDIAVAQLIPDYADPHAYEPSLRTIRDVVYADVVFSNGLLLEEQSLTETLHQANHLVPLAEVSTRYGARVRPLVEDVSLDTIWLGLRVLGGTSAEDVVQLQAPQQDITGPGQLTAFVTSTFGRPEVYIDTNRPAAGATLPGDAHTHLSWAFSKPGVYRVPVTARHERRNPSGQTEPSPDQQQLQETPIDGATIVFAVGVDPYAVAREQGRTEVLGAGHHDIAVDLEHRNIALVGDGDDGPRTRRDANNVVIAVPANALQQIPATAEYRFLGRPGQETYMLRQAVLGKHVHGEMDPHVWLDVANAQAWVQVIRDELVALDPKHAAGYSARAQAYLEELDGVNSVMQHAVSAIDPSHRSLVTTHDAYGYMADAYGLDIAGFVSPNPAVEPSARDVVALTRLLEHRGISAVFVQPNASNRASDLRQLAHRTGVQVCKLYGDGFDDEATNYVEMMRHNAEELQRCLEPGTQTLGTAEQPEQ